MSDNSCNGKSIIFDPENDIMGTNVEDYDSGYLSTIDNETKYFTENNFRKELVQAYHHNDYYIRPLYGSSAEQIRITQYKIKISNQI